MQRLTILSPLVPYPPRAGGSLHILRAAGQLARFFSLEYYLLTEHPAAVEWGPLAQQCAATAAFRRSPPQGAWLDPPAARQEQSLQLRRHLESVWAERPPELVQFELTTMAQYAALARRYGALTICTALNIGFRDQFQRARRERDPRQRFRRLAAALSFWQFELRVLRACDLVVTLSPFDRAAIQRWLPKLPVAYVPSGIDLSQWPPCFDPLVENEVLFVGNYQHPPNLEGAQWLVREVWPLVRRARPEARLTLAGREPPPAIQALAGPDIRVPGTLADLRPLYAGASLMVAPIFWGSGVRIKILETLASGLPLVTTRAAAEGLDITECALFAEQPAQFAGAILRLLEDRTLRVRLGAAGLATARRSYDWQRIGERLAGLYSGAWAKRTKNKE